MTGTLRYLPALQKDAPRRPIVHHYEREYQPQLVENGTLSILSIVEMVRRNLLLGLLLIPLGIASGILITLHLTPVYKSPGVLHIQSTYFKEPLVNDLIPEEFDQSELRARRDSLIQMALSDEFLLKTYHEHPELKADLRLKNISEPLNDQSKALVLFHLRKRIEYFGLSPSTFQISSRASKPELAMFLSEAFVKQILVRMREERAFVLENARRAITEHVRELASELKAIERSLKVSDQGSLSEEFIRLKADLDALLVHYTDQHPKVSQLKQEVRSVELRLKAYQAAHGKNQEEVKGIFNKIPRSEAARQPTQDVYNELLKKLSYLQIALSLESDDVSQHLRIVQHPTYPVEPTFPRKDMFALIGALVGLLFWIIGMIVREARAAHPEAQDILALADSQQVPLLGFLPDFNEEELRRNYPMTAAPASSGGYKASKGGGIRVADDDETIIVPPPEAAAGGS